MGLLNIATVSVVIVFIYFKKTFLLIICTENMIVLSPSQTMSLLSLLNLTMCLFTSLLSHVLKNHIDRKHLGILKTFECNKWDFSAKGKGVLKHHEHIRHKKRHPNV